MKALLDLFPSPAAVLARTPPSNDSAPAATDQAAGFSFGLSRRGSEGDERVSAAAAAASSPQSPPGADADFVFGEIVDMLGKIR